MDQPRATRPRPLRQATEADAGGGGASALPTLARRSRLREERHPNAVTAPPIHRGSMPTQPWRGFWNSIGTAGLGLANRLLSPAAPQPRRAATHGWERAAL